MPWWCTSIFLPSLSTPVISHCERVMAKPSPTVVWWVTTSM
jgi:hypothetical protein